MSSLTTSCRAHHGLDHNDNSRGQTLIPVAGDRLDVAKEGLAILGSDVEWSEGGSDIDNLEGQLRGEEEGRLKDAVAAEELSEEVAEDQIRDFPSAKQNIESWRH